MSDDLMFPTFTLPYGARPWKAAAADDTRPVLWNGWLRKRGEDWWLLTTDSYIACALKVQTTGELREGQVPRAVLRLMHRGAVAAQLPDGAWRVVWGGEWTWRPTIDAPASFPDFEKLGMWDEPGETTTDTIGLDPRLSNRLRRALGGQQSGLTFRFTAKAKNGDPRLSCVQVVPHSDPGDRRGLQMPVRLS